MQIHDDEARERVEAFIRGEDSEVLVGTEEVAVRRTRRVVRGRPTAGDQGGAVSGSNGTQPVPAEPAPDAAEPTTATASGATER